MMSVRVRPEESLSFGGGADIQQFVTQYSHHPQALFFRQTPVNTFFFGQHPIAN